MAMLVMTRGYIPIFSCLNHNFDWDFHIFLLNSTSIFFVTYVLRELRRSYSPAALRGGSMTPTVTWDKVAAKQQKHGFNGGLIWDSTMIYIGFYIGFTVTMSYIIYHISYIYISYIYIYIYI